MNEANGRRNRVRPGPPPSAMGGYAPHFLPARGAAALAAVWCVELMRCTTRIYLVYLRVPVGALPLPSGVSWPLEVSPAFTAPSPVRF